MNMEEIVRDLPGQLARAYDVAQASGVAAKPEGCRAICVGGMGGSAIAGDILGDYVGTQLNVPLRIIRGYTLMPCADGKFLFVAASYSGNTEEVLSLLDQAESAGADICVVTTGGALKERADASGYPTILIPEGYPPRGALGYSFVSLLYLLRAFYPAIDTGLEVRKAAGFLEHLVSGFGSPAESSFPYKLAGDIKGMIPVIYASSHIASVAVRWKTQFSENAKVLAFLGLLPEMNHNEICGWQNNTEALKRMYVIFLRDEGEHPRVRQRMEITREMVEELSGGVTEVISSGNSLLERIFSLICSGDFVSFFLSRFLDTDPVPIEKIDSLKERLAHISPEE